jgi:drug/metabolite transporter superfamily protein YnfA
MNAFLARQLREVTAALEITGGRLITSVILGVLASLALLAGLAFLAVALFLKIAALAGTIYAALAVGGAFIVIALLALIILRLRRPKGPKAPKPAPVEAEKAARHAALAANIDETIAPVLAALHNADMKPEELALRVGAELSKQTGGFGLIALAVAAGFVAARQIGGGKKP